MSSYFVIVILLGSALGWAKEPGLDSTPAHESGVASHREDPAIQVGDLVYVKSLKKPCMLVVRQVPPKSDPFFKVSQCGNVYESWSVADVDMEKATWEPDCSKFCADKSIADRGAHVVGPSTPPWFKWSDGLERRWYKDHWWKRSPQTNKIELSGDLPRVGGGVEYHFYDGQWWVWDPQSNRSEISTEECAQSRYRHGVIVPLGCRR